MRFIAALILLFLALSLIETTRASNLRDIHCNGFVKNGDEKIFYKLSGKIVKDLKGYYLVKGYSPVYKKNMTHKISKKSCADTLSELTPKVTRVKKITEIPPEVEKELVIESEAVIETNNLVSSFKKEKELEEKGTKEVSFKEIEAKPLDGNSKQRSLNLREYFDIILR